HCLLSDIDVAEDAHEHRNRATVLLSEHTLDIDQRLASLNGRTSIGSVVARAIFAAHASAASRSGAVMTVSPPRNSLPSANGPSVIRTSPSLKRATVAVLGGCKPPANTHAPAALISRLTASSSRRIGSRTSRGGTP